MKNDVDPGLSKGALGAFSFILRNQPATRADICAFMGVGAVTAGKYVQELLERGMIKENGYEDSSGGRKPIVYAVNDSERFILCINISTIYCELAAADFNLKLHCIRRFGIHFDDSPELVIERIGEAYAAIKEKMGLSDGAFIGAGVILFGTAKDESGVMFKPIQNYNDTWIDFPVLDRIRSTVPLPVFWEKGITATAALEYGYGVGKAHKSMLFILCAMNIRSAFVINGEVQGRSVFYEDAFGHMVVDYDGPLCQCGQYGCLNCYASIPAVIKEFRSRVKRGEETCIEQGADGAEIEDICRAADNGDLASAAAVADCARMLGIALANYVNVTSPDIVLVSGLLAELSGLYYETAVETARAHLKNTGNEGTVFRRTGSFSYPLTTSAAALVLDRMFGK